MEPGTGNYIENVAIDVLAETMGDAIQKAKFLVPGKKVYSVRQCIEHFENQCARQ